MRRANHDKVVAPSLAACSHCGEPVVSHRVCPSCGYYKGAKVTGEGAKVGELAAARRAALVRLLTKPGRPGSDEPLPLTGVEG
jgi:large subunit ribosomal protein L32